MDSKIVSTIKHNIPLLIMLFVAIFIIFNIYKSPITSPNIFITTIYLYLFVSILVISFLGQYFSLTSITDSNNMLKMFIIYFVMAFGGLFLLAFKTGFVTRHIGYILMLIALSMIIGVNFRNSTPEQIKKAGLYTAFAVSILTFIVYNSSEEQLYKTSGYESNLIVLLCGLIIVNLIVLFFGGSQLALNILGLSSIGIFSGIILYNTSKLALKSKQVIGQSPYEINYPFESYTLTISILNLFQSFSN
jgi:FtsH-binding integral membrane protein